MDINDELFIDLLKKGNREAQEILYDELAPKIVGKCLTMVKDMGKAQDLAHDIFIKVFLSVANFKGNSKLTTWIYYITFNHCISYLRRTQNITKEVFLGDEIPEVAIKEDTSVFDIADAALVWKAVEKLAPAQRIVIELTYQDQLKISEIAEVLGLGESAVKMRIKRGREQLSVLLKQTMTYYEK